MYRAPGLLVGSIVVLLAPVASAHHGFGAHYYPDRYITIEGTVRQFDFVNPHAVLHIDGMNDAGESVVYVCALQARTQLVRRGVSEELFSVGDPIRVEGFAARRDPYGCEFGTAYFADGSSFTMRSREGQTVFADNRAAPADSSATHSIFGNWIRPTLYGPAGGRRPSTGEESITPAGLAAKAGFDPIHDNPVVDCSPGSPVRTWGAPGLVTSIQQGDDEISIHHESMDVTRTIHMGLSEHPADLALTTMGHSIGRYEGGTLVIDSAGFSAGVLNFDILHSDAMTMTESLRVEPDTGDLEISWTVNDPAYYSEPLTGGQALSSTDQEIVSYECVPGALPASL